MQYRKGVHVPWARVLVQVRGPFFPSALRPYMPRAVTLIGSDNSTRMCISYEFQKYIPYV
jgi:hypothetical protein